MENMIGQCLLYIILLALLAWPLGIYMGKVMDGEPLWLQKILAPCERTIYRVMGVNPAEKMSWKHYLCCVLLFSLVSIAALMVLLMVQHSLPLNPQGIADSSWHLALNTAVSFVSNTNWQAYSGENAMSYLAYEPLHINNWMLCYLVPQSKAQEEFHYERSYKHSKRTGSNRTILTGNKSRRIPLLVRPDSP